MTDDISKLRWLVRHSRRTLAIIRQNITLALAIKAVFVALTLLEWQACVKAALPGRVQRNCIERVLGHLKINRAIATRYDQLAESFLGMLFIASARYWIKFVHAA